MSANLYISPSRERFAKFLDVEDASVVRYIDWNDSYRARGPTNFYRSKCLGRDRRVFPPTMPLSLPCFFSGLSRYLAPLLSFLIAGVRVFLDTTKIIAAFAIFSRRCISFPRATRRGFAGNISSVSRLKPRSHRLSS